MPAVWPLTYVLLLHIPKRKNANQLERAYDATATAPDDVVEGTRGIIVPCCLARRRYPSPAGSTLPCLGPPPLHRRALSPSSMQDCDEHLSDCISRLREEANVARVTPCHEHQTTSITKFIVLELGQAGLPPHSAEMNMVVAVIEAASGRVESAPPRRQPLRVTHILGIETIIRRGARPCYCNDSIIDDGSGRHAHAQRRRRRQRQASPRARDPSRACAALTRDALRACTRRRSRACWCRWRQ